MTYDEYLKELKGCPFCRKDQRMLAETENAFLTYCLAPYYVHHLLVIPKRHIISIHELSLEEESEATALVRRGIEALYKLGHEDCTAFVRDAKNPGKSIGHLHYHIVPHVAILGDPRGGQRPILTNDEIDRTMREVGEALE